MGGHHACPRRARPPKVTEHLLGDPCAVPQPGTFSLLFSPPRESYLTPALPLVFLSGVLSVSVKDCPAPLGGSRQCLDTFRVVKTQ